jgi:hypothetical protein
MYSSKSEGRLSGGFKRHLTTPLQYLHIAFTTPNKVHIEKITDHIS